MKTMRSKSKKHAIDEGGFIRSIALARNRVDSFRVYPYSIPAIRELNLLKLHPKVTYFVGENGSGKSTLIEAIAVAAGFNAEGGSTNFNFATRRTDSNLHEAIQIGRGVRRETDGFFMRAESLYNVASNIDEVGVTGSYGGKSLHAQSHGESFLALAKHRFRGNGFYILDEPESALSPTRQLSFLRLIHDHVTSLHSQFLIATHSPILMAYPDSIIYNLTSKGITTIEYEETEHFKITSDFLANREMYLQYLLSSE